MYYPIQIPYILQSEFFNNVIYSEKRVADLSDFVICFWQMLPKTEKKCQINNIIVTDGCVDLVADFDNKLIGYAGMSKTDFDFSLIMPGRLFGARLMPGAFQQLTGVAAKKVMDDFIPLIDIDSTFDLEYFFSLSFDVANAVFVEYFQRLTSGHTPNNFTTLFTETINDIPDTVQKLSANLYLSPRQCQRLFAKHFGLTPKMVLSILRFQNALSLLIDNTKDTKKILKPTNYYDQPHFIKDFKRNIGLTPLELIGKYQK